MGVCKIQFALCYVFLFLKCSGLHAQSQLFVLSYNTYNGFQNDTIIQQQYVNWVKKSNPHIIAYQEMNGFDQKKLEAFAREYGHSFAVLSKTGGYPVALTSEFPIVNVQKVLDNMNHGYIYANTFNTHVFVVHLSPADYVKRTNELQTVLAHAATLPNNEPVIILGDFNALSKKDAEYYGLDLLEALRKRDEVYNQNNLSGNVLDYSVMDLMPATGFYDSYWEASDSYQYSLPTLRYQTRPVRRIDYIWVNEYVKDDILDAGIIVDDDTDIMSDHYPTYLKLNLK